LVEMELRNLRPDTLNMASVCADLKGHAIHPADDADDPVLPAFRKRVPHEMLSTRLSPVVHESKSIDNAKHEHAGRSDACTQEDSVSLLNTLQLLASPQGAQRCLRTFRRRPCLDLRHIFHEVNEKTNKSSLQSPQNLSRRRLVDPPKSVAGAGCTLGTSVSRSVRILELMGSP